MLKIKDRVQITKVPTYSPYYEKVGTVVGFWMDYAVVEFDHLDFSSVINQDNLIPWVDFD